MESKLKKNYAAPTSEILEVQMQSMLCGLSNVKKLMIYDQLLDPGSPSSFGDTWTWDE